MKYNKYCFAINSYQQAKEVIKICINNNIFPILFIKYFIINKMGKEWLIELNNLIKKDNIKKNFKIFVDCKKNYGLLISIIELKIDYLKTDADKNTFNRLNQIAKKNKVSLNPNFSVVDLSKIQNINKKIKNILNN